MEETHLNVGDALQQAHDIAKRYFDVHTMEINPEDNRFIEVSMTLNGRRAETSFSVEDIQDWVKEGTFAENVSSRFKQFRDKLE